MNKGYIRFRDSMGFGAAVSETVLKVIKTWAGLFSWTWYWSLLCQSLITLLNVLNPCFQSQELLQQYLKFCHTILKIAQIYGKILKTLREDLVGVDMSEDIRLNSFFRNLIMKKWLEIGMKKLASSRKCWYFVVSGLIR